MADLIDYENRITNNKEFRRKRAELLKDLHGVFQWHLRRTSHGRRWPKWRGVSIFKFPMDLSCYSEAIWTNQPDWIIETGTMRGGSALFFADMLQLAGGQGTVITIDVNQKKFQQHPRVSYMTGYSTDPTIVNHIQEIIYGKVMVVLDSDHSEENVSQEIDVYSKMVTKGQYMVVEDCVNPYHKDFGPNKAVRKFLKRTDMFIKDPYYDDKFLIGVTQGGWLKRV